MPRLLQHPTRRGIMRRRQSVADIGHVETIEHAKRVASALRCTRVAETYSFAWSRYPKKPLEETPTGFRIIASRSDHALLTVMEVHDLRAVCVGAIGAVVVWDGRIFSADEHN